MSVHGQCILLQDHGLILICLILLGHWLRLLFGLFSFGSLAPELDAFAFGLLAPFFCYYVVDCWALAATQLLVLLLLTKPQLRMTGLRV